MLHITTSTSTDVRDTIEEGVSGSTHTPSLFKGLAVNVVKSRHHVVAYSQRLAMGVADAYNESGYISRKWREVTGTSLNWMCKIPRKEYTVIDTTKVIYPIKV